IVRWFFYLVLGKPSPVSPARGGIAGQDCELLWSTRVYEIPSTKHQITNKSQIPISNDQNRFGILKLGTRPQGGESEGQYRTRNFEQQKFL
ncbi:MAG: hypothetical protein WBH05_05245, partial [Syntrophobacteria bacterium]